MEPMQRTEVADNELSAPGVTSVSVTKSKAPKILGALLVIALVVAAVFAWLWQQEASRQDSSSAQLSTVKNENSNLKQTISDLKKGDTAKEMKPPVVNQDVQLKNAITAYQQAKTNLSGKSVQVQIDKQTDLFASAEVSGAGTSGAIQLYAKNVNGTWVVIGDGGTDLTFLQEIYGLPKGF